MLRQLYLKNAAAIIVASIAMLMAHVPVEAAVVSTTGTTFDMSLGSTWVGGVVPGSGDIARFAHTGTNTAPALTTFDWYGIQSAAPGNVEINPGSGGNAYTINLGAGGISGNPYRIGANLTIDIGAMDQTWSITNLTQGIQADIAGTATITCNGSGRVWLRGPNTFSGTWRADGTSAGIHPDGTVNWGSASGADAELLNNGYIRLSNSAYDRIGAITLAGDGRILVSGATTDNGTLATLEAPGAIPNAGDTLGSGDLTVTANSNYGKLQMQGDLGHTGDTIIANKSAGVTLDLHANSTVTFTIGANGVNNQIRGGDATNSKLLANGTFIFDRSGADLTSGNTWTVVDVATLAETFGVTFDVSGFTANPDSVTWTQVLESNTWTFSETSGVLSVADGGYGPVQSVTVIHEPFADADSTLNGNTPGTGLSGTWSSDNGSVSAQALSYGNLATSGNQASKPTGLSLKASVGTSSALADAGLLEHGRTLWFSVLWRSGQSGANPQSGFALGTAPLDSSNLIPMSSSGNGVGFFLARNSRLYASVWSGGVIASDAAYQSIAAETTHLVVGKIIWGVDGVSADTVDLYLPDEALDKGSVVSTKSLVLDQSTFDTVSVGFKADGEVVFDEIRFGSTYADVTPPPPDKGTVFRFK